MDLISYPVTLLVCRSTTPELVSMNIAFLKEGRIPPGRQSQELGSYAFETTTYLLTHIQVDLSTAGSGIFLLLP